MAFHPCISLIGWRGGSDTCFLPGESPAGTIGDGRSWDVVWRGISMVRLMAYGEGVKVVFRGDVHGRICRWGRGMVLRMWAVVCVAVSERQGTCRWFYGAEVSGVVLFPSGASCIRGTSGWLIRWPGPMVARDGGGAGSCVQRGRNGGSCSMAAGNIAPARGAWLRHDICPKGSCHIIVIVRPPWVWLQSSPRALPPPATSAAQLAEKELSDGLESGCPT